MRILPRYHPIIATCQSGQSVDAAHVGDAPLLCAVTEHDASSRPFAFHTRSSDPDRVTTLLLTVFTATEEMRVRWPGSSRTNA